MAGKPPRRIWRRCWSDFRRTPFDVLRRDTFTSRRKNWPAKGNEAIQTVERGEQIVKDESLLRGVAHRIYDKRSQQHAARQQWSQAVDVYAEGLRRYPNDSHLTHNAIVTWDAWASTHLDKQEWAEAIEIYQRGLEAFPNASQLQNNLAYSQEQLSSE